MKNYVDAFKYAPIGQYFCNSVIIVGASIVITVVLVSVCAYVTAHYNFKLEPLVCKLCVRKDADKYEIHHVNKVKNLSGKELWKQIMIAKRRKTMVVCYDCHQQIHHGLKKKADL